MAGVPPLPLPPPQAMPAVRVDVPLSDGSYAQQLVASDGSAAYQFLRTLQEALMGKVKSAVVCARAGGAAWAPPAPGAPHTLVAVKQLLKSCVRERRTRAGKPVQEDPLREVAVLRMLQARAGAGAAAAADVAQRHVMRLISFLEDEKYFFIVYEFLDGGELFSQVQAHGKVPEARAARHFFDTLMGTRFCHDCAVAHRDLSLENVMLTGGGGGGGGGGAGAEPASPAAAAVATAKLIDFGLAVVMPPAGTLLAWDGRVGKERCVRRGRRARERTPLRARAAPPPLRRPRSLPPPRRPAGTWRPRRTPARRTTGGALTCGAWA
jgi:serine/threonine protein kinase